MPTMTLTFPTIPQPNDPTDAIWNQVAGFARDLEHAATDATSPARCAQLHDRIMACLRTLNDADAIVRKRWDDLLLEQMELPASWDAFRTDDTKA